MANSIRKVIWAVDPFSDEPLLQGSAVTALEKFSSGHDLEIFPVFVWDVALDGALKEQERKRLRARGEEVITRLLKGSSLKTRPLVLLEKGYSSVKSRAEAMVRFAKTVQADLIVLSTHSRGLPEKWFLGSFAETISLISDVPLLVTHLRWKPTSAARKSVLFATDFSERSLAAFVKLIEWAKGGGWSVTIYHRVRFPAYPAYELGFMAGQAYEENLKEEIRQRTEEAILLGRAAKKIGLHSKIIIDQIGSSDVTSGVLRQLKKNYSMVAIAAQSGVLARTFLGSTTRRLIREASVPVWVIRPKQKGFPAELRRPDLRDESDQRISF